LNQTGRPGLQGLYAITDGRQGESLCSAVESLIAGGARLIQYRDKSSDHQRRLAEGHRLRRLCSDGGALLIINDDIDLALSVGADGVHLGENDLSPAVARARLGRQALIGISCYNEPERAQRHAATADYLAFGAFFPSSTKPAARRADLALLAEAATFGIPLVAIGGITRANAASLIAAGADMVAVISDLYAGGDDEISERAASFAALFHAAAPRSGNLGSA
jgi:thiamine-phosphate pyrophosphorylase